MDLNSYNEKYIIAGNKIIYRNYNGYYITKGRPSSGGRKSKSAETIHLMADCQEILGEAFDFDFDMDLLGKVKKNRRAVVTRALQNIRLLADTNFNKAAKFFTLTFDKNKINFDPKNIKECNIAFRKFIKRLNKKYNCKARYIAVIEFQDGDRIEDDNREATGHIHYHILITDIPFIPVSEFYYLNKGITDHGRKKNEFLDHLWGYGGIQAKRIDQVDNISTYLLEYMTKNIADPRFMGERSYLTSLNLQKPTVITNEYFSHKLNIEHERLGKITSFQQLDNKLDNLGYNENNFEFKDKYNIKFLSNSGEENDFPVDTLEFNLLKKEQKKKVSKRALS